MNGKQKPNSQFLEILLSAFPDIDARWLLTGEANLVVEESRTNYGFCKECLKKEGVIEFLRKELDTKNKLITAYRQKLGYDLGEESQTGEKIAL